MHPKKIFFLTAIILTTLHSTAQNQSVQIGIQAGPAIVFLKGNSILDTMRKNKLSFTIGIPVAFNINDNVAIISGLYYQKKGTALKTQTVFNNDGSTLGNRKASINQDYISIPIMLRTYFGDNIKFFINTGPYCSYLLKNNTESQIEGQPKVSENNIANYKRFDVGLSAGLGIAMPLQQNLHCSFEIRTNTGLTNSSKVPVINNGKIKTNALEFMLGLSYKPGKK